MSATAGKSSPGKLFGAIELTGALTLGRLLVLLALGVTIVLLERAFRWPLQLPGHHGLEAMALLVIARLSCSSRWSASIAATGAALTAEIAGAGHGPFMPLLYLAPGLLLDLGMRWQAVLQRQLLLLPALAALAFASKPLLRWLAQLGFGLEFGSLRAGVLYPLLTHLVFGLVGGLIAVLLWRAATTVRAPGAAASK